MSFQQSLSGLNAASKNLDVIGHNIANSSTTGFKISRAEFTEALATAVGSASGTSTGIGASVSTVSQQFKQGDINSTGNNLDVAINGNGFFMLRQPDGSQAFSRAGNFKLDREGFVKTVSNDNVMGYPVDPATGRTLTGASPVPMYFPSGQAIPAKSTTAASVQMNLDARVALPDPATPIPRGTYGTSMEVYDSQGVPTPLNLYFVKNAANSWDIYTTLDETEQPPGSPIGTLTFDASGQPTPMPVPLIAVTLAATNNPNSPDPENIEFELDMNQVTQFGTDFAVNNLKQDGYTAGLMTGLNIGKDGSIMIAYSNNVSRVEGQLALASFTNPQGLEPAGDNKWMASPAAGTMVPGTAQSGTFGSLQSGALEASNVDLTAELVNLMTAQRSYQSNAQAIKTQDQVFSTLVNLR